jgi:hypothetical protein
MRHDFVHKLQIFNSSLHRCLLYRIFRVQRRLHSCTTEATTPTATYTGGDLFTHDFCTGTRNSLLLSTSNRSRQFRQCFCGYCTLHTSKQIFHRSTCDRVVCLAQSVLTSPSCSTLLPMPAPSITHSHKFSPLLCTTALSSARMVASRATLPPHVAHHTRA